MEVPMKLKKKKRCQSEDDAEVKAKAPQGARKRKGSQLDENDSNERAESDGPTRSENDELLLARDVLKKGKRKKSKTIEHEQQDVDATGPAAGAPEQGTELQEESAGSGLDSLMKLRSLLTPAGFTEASAALSTAPGSDRTAEEAEGPDWTSRYHVVRASDPPIPLEEFTWPLHAAVHRALRKAGFKSLFPIQGAVIPLLMRSAETAYDPDSPYSCDVCVAAPTGQGKTLAYAVPVVQALLHRAAPRPRALVVLPTRDLALQVFRVFEMLRQGLGPGVAQVRTQCLIGQRSFAEECRTLAERPPDVLVCTPGRLADHALGREGQLDLGALRWFIADEADRLLTQTYHRWLDVLEKVSTLRPAEDGKVGAGPRLQRLLLSATMTWNPQKLAMLKLRRPLFFFSSQTGKHATPAELRQFHLKCKPGAKPLAVLHLLSCMLGGELDGSEGVGTGRAIVFCPSVDTAHRLARLLQVCCLGDKKATEESMNLEGLETSEAAAEALEEAEEEDAINPEEEMKDDDADVHAEPEASSNRSTLEIHEALQGRGTVAEFSSTLSQRERTALLRNFRRGVVRCIVCSDVVARGIDIPEVNMVINYSAPSHLQTYIHRVGRTARAGRVGHTFTFVRRSDMGRFEEMLRKSADSWERIRNYPLPKNARDTEQAWYPSALDKLRECLKLEEKGLISPSQPLVSSDLDSSGTPMGPASDAKSDGNPGKTKKRQLPHQGKDSLHAATTGPSNKSMLDFFRTLRPDVGHLLRV